MKVKTLLVMIGCTMMWATTSQGQNLLTDPGFENGTIAPNPNPTGIPGWGTFGGAGEIADPNSHGGLFNMYMNGAPGGYYVPGAFEVFAASPGQKYTLSGWVFTPNVLVAQSNDFAILQLSFFTGAPPNNYATGGIPAAQGGVAGVNFGTPAGTGPAVPLPQGVWTFGSVTATAPTGTNSMGAYILNINADANAVFQFDDMSLTLAPPLAAGDYNKDGHVNAADVTAAELALTNLPLYESTYGVSSADLATITGVPGQSNAGLDNSDMQALIKLLKSGGGSASAVPEPASLMLMALAGLGCLALRKRLA